MRGRDARRAEKADERFSVSCESRVRYLEPTRYSRSQLWLAMGPTNYSPLHSPLEEVTAP